MYGFSETWFNRKRVEGSGPRFVQVAHGVRYRITDLEAYFASKVLDSTSGKHKGKRGRKPKEKDSSRVAPNDASSAGITDTATM